MGHAARLLCVAPFLLPLAPAQAAAPSVKTVSFVLRIAGGNFVKATDVLWTAPFNQEAQPFSAAQGWSRTPQAECRLP